jgi:phosphoribosylformimino-5-aminoimidazole carboxamide ribotide isomerase
MRVIPAIDLRGGKCVRLVEGVESSAKVYDRDPLEAAASYEHDGAELIHIVDLDGAFLGARSDNQAIIRRIIDSIRIPVEVGGGVRSLADIKNLTEVAGARFVIIGTLAVEQPEVVAAAVRAFGDTIVAGIDARGLQVAVRGWKTGTAVDALELARRVQEMGVQRIVYTDITRDGRLEGPNIEAIRQVARAAGTRVTASGGVGSIADILGLCELENDGVDSVIVGKALYEGRFGLAEAIGAAEQRN